MTYFQIEIPFILRRLTAANCLFQALESQNGNYTSPSPFFPSNQEINTSYSIETRNAIWILKRCPAIEDDLADHGNSCQLISPLLSWDKGEHFCLFKAVQMLQKAEPRGHIKIKIPYFDISSAPDSFLRILRVVEDDKKALIHALLNQKRRNIFEFPPSFFKSLRSNSSPSFQEIRNCFESTCSPVRRYFMDFTEDDVSFYFPSTLCPALVAVYIDACIWLVNI